MTVQELGKILKNVFNMQILLGGENNDFEGIYESIKL